MRNRHSQNGEKEDTDFWGWKMNKLGNLEGEGLYLLFSKIDMDRQGGSVKRDQSIILPLGLLKTASYKQRDWSRLRVGEKLAKPPRDLQLCFDFKK